MQDPNHQEREEQLRQREIDLRLRELEVEIYQSASPFHPTSKNTSSNNNKPVRTFKRDVVIATKFSGFFFASVIVVFISQWLAWMSFFALIGVAGWACFELGRKS